MKWAYSIRHKLKAAIVLTIILLVIIGGNFVIRQKFNTVDRSMTSIYNDRLKPSVFIYEISQHLYQKRLLLSEIANASVNSPAIEQHNNTIASIIQRYEQTYLTNEESRQWASFKTHLATYNQMEYAFTSNNNTAVSKAKLVHQFDKTIHDLNALNDIQMTVGQGLQQDTHAAVGNTMILSTLEISMLIILGLFTLVILSTSDNTLFNQYQKNMNLN